LGEINYRPIQPEDYEPVRQFLTALGWQSRVQDPLRFKKILERADRTVVVLEDTRVIGFGRALCDDVSNGYLSMIAVAEDKRRQGIGTEIVKRLMTSDDAGKVTWVLRAGRGSREFWRKLGFTESQVAMERLRQTQDRPGSSNSP
jgi:N-acetylglutamate synthase-like GNAT family acetyltransferase